MPPTAPSQKITEIDADTYYNYAIIRGKSKPDKKVFRLVVDSRERNRNIFPNPNTYEVNLQNDIPYVTEVKLIRTSFPFSAYLINANNNSIHFSVASTDLVAKVEVGDYADGDDLARAIQDAMNATMPGDIFQVEYVARTDNFALRCTRSFTLGFKGPSVRTAFNANPDFIYPERSIAPIIGFGIKRYDSMLEPSSSLYKNTVRSEFRKNFDVNDTLVVNIELLNLNSSTMNAFNDSFAIVAKGGEKVADYDDFAFCKQCNPPIGRLAKIKISITDAYGLPYDFQNQDHRMEFLVDANIKNRS